MFLFFSAELNSKSDWMTRIETINRLINVSAEQKLFICMYNIYMSLEGLAQVTVGFSNSNA